MAKQVESEIAAYLCSKHVTVFHHDRQPDSDYWETDDGLVITTDSIGLTLRDVDGDMVFVPWISVRSVLTYE